MVAYQHHSILFELDIATNKMETITKQYLKKHLHDLQNLSGILLPNAIYTAAVLVCTGRDGRDPAGAREASSLP
jgi:hypothetical protein